jgi:E3 ubiquitin-protein ligase synoviolin
MALLKSHLAYSIGFVLLVLQEREIMYDRARYAITETCLALTIFHEELSVKVFALFTALLFSKVFHWLCECRVEFIQQDDGANYWKHFRLVSLIVRGTLMPKS